MNEELFQLGVILLNSSSILQLSSSLTLLNHFEFHTAFPLLKKSKKLPRVLLKGILVHTTSPLCLEFTLQYASVLDEKHPQLVLLLLMIYATLVCSDDLPSKYSPAAFCERLGPTFADMKKVFEKKLTSTELDGGRKTFIDAFFPLIAKQFPSQTEFDFMFETITTMLRRGFDKWKFSLLKIISALLFSFPFVCNSEQMTTLTELVAYLCMDLCFCIYILGHHSHERVALAAQEMLPVITKQIDQTSANIPLEVGK
jgi:hypothetical protein